ncbi:MAG: type I restriction enzyme HsdR N-terminal domain-containing protein [Breznakibacter sp.]
MQPLNLPTGPFKIKKDQSRYKIYDMIRRKYVVLTPEEWVRQHIIHYLINDKHYPAGLTAVEHLVVINQLRQRADVVIYDRNRKPLLIVECKAPSVAITTGVFEQALRYNMVLGVRIVVVSNGITHLAARLDDAGGYALLSQIPDYSQVMAIIGE